MKINRIIYWTATILLALGMGMSSMMYFTSGPEITKNFTLLGYPPYIIYFLGAAKLFGAVALVVPRFPRLKEWAYAGFGFCFAGAIWSHVATNTPFAGALVFLLLLGVSYVFYLRSGQAASSSARLAAA